MAYSGMKSLQPTALYCAHCHEKLYSCFTLSGGHPVIAPVNSQVPYFSEGIVNCPFCEQPMNLVLSDRVRSLWKNEATGRFMVA